MDRQTRDNGADRGRLMSAVDALRGKKKKHSRAAHNKAVSDLVIAINERSYRKAACVRDELGEEKLPLTCLKEVQGHGLVHYPILMLALEAVEDELNRPERNNRRIGDLLAIVDLLVSHDEDKLLDQDFGSQTGAPWTVMTQLSQRISPHEHAMKQGQSARKLAESSPFSLLRIFHNQDATALGALISFFPSPEYTGVFHKYVNTRNYIPNTAITHASSRWRYLWDVVAKGDVRNIKGEFLQALSRAGYAWTGDIMHWSKLLAQHPVIVGDRTAVGSCLADRFHYLLLGAIEGDNHVVLTVINDLLVDDQAILKSLVLSCYEWRFNTNDEICEDRLKVMQHLVSVGGETFVPHTIKSPADQAYIHALSLEVMVSQRTIQASVYAAVGDHLHEAGNRHSMVGGRVPSDFALEDPGEDYEDPDTFTSPLERGDSPKVKEDLTVDFADTFSRVPDEAKIARLQRLFTERKMKQLAYWLTSGAKFSDAHISVIRGSSVTDPDLLSCLINHLKSSKQDPQWLPPSIRSYLTESVYAPMHAPSSGAGGHHYAVPSSLPVPLARGQYSAPTRPVASSASGDVSRPDKGSGEEPIYKEPFPKGGPVAQAFAPAGPVYANLQSGDVVVTTGPDGQSVIQHVGEGGALGPAGAASKPTPAPRPRAATATGRRGASRSDAAPEQAPSVGAQQSARQPIPAPRKPRAPSAVGGGARSLGLSANVAGLYGAPTRNQRVDAANSTASAQHGAARSSNAARYAAGAKR